MPDFEWNLAKERQNIEKHKIDFSTACRIWEGVVLERNDSRRDYGEVRIEASGKVDGRLMVVIFTWRGGSSNYPSTKG